MVQGGIVTVPAKYWKDLDELVVKLIEKHSAFSSDLHKEPKKINKT
jgi:hypothetical protein